MNHDSKLRILGLFFGQLIGDALGTRYEFKCNRLATKSVKRDIINNKLPILGDGPHNVEPGQYTDDSELALGIWYSLLTNEDFDIDDIVKQFYNWYKSCPFDVGHATETSFGSGSTRTDMLNNSKLNAHSLSNGCLMKISPLGALSYLSNNGYSTQTIASQVCELTNPNEICIDMSICYVRAIEIALKSGNPKLVFAAVKNIAKCDITKQILKDSQNKSTPCKYISNDEIIYVNADKPFQGYIGIAFQNAFYHLLNSSSYSEVMIKTICLGGDVDTNACIAGALFGACFGIKNIEKDWINTVAEYQSSPERKKLYKPINHQYVYSLLHDKIKKM